MSISWNQIIVGATPLHRALNASQKVVVGASWTPQFITNIFENRIVTRISDFSYNYFFSYFQPALDYVAPYSAISGHRTFSIIPLFLEKFLGESIFYPNATKGMKNTNKFKESVEEVYNKLKLRNPNILNAKTKDNPNGYNYRVKIVESKTVNAFACPAGGMVVYTGIVSKIEAALQTTKFAQITLLNGAKIRVDLRGVTLEDALAALMGHEMAHVASRHGMGKMVTNLSLFSLFKGVTYFAVSFLKKHSQEYQTLLNKEQKTPEEVARFEKIEKSFNRVHYLADRTLNFVRNLLLLSHSRSCEYEADVAGIYLANQSGYNPLGAIFLEEVLTKLSSGAKIPEILQTHPIGEHRKLSALAAIDQIDSDKLHGKIRVVSEGTTNSLFLKHIKKRAINS